MLRECQNCPYESIKETETILAFIFAKKNPHHCSETYTLKTVKEVFSDLGPLANRAVNFADLIYRDKNAQKLTRVGELRVNGQKVPHLLHAVRVGGMAYSRLKISYPKYAKAGAIAGFMHDGPEDTGYNPYVILRGQCSDDFKKLNVRENFEEIFQIQEVYRKKIQLLLQKNLKTFVFDDSDSKEDLILSSKITSDLTRINPPFKKGVDDWIKTFYKQKMFLETFKKRLKEEEFWYAFTYFVVKFEDLLDNVYSYSSDLKGFNKALARREEVNLMIEELVKNTEGISYEEYNIFDKAIKDIQFDVLGDERLYTWYSKIKS